MNPLRWFRRSPRLPRGLHHGEAAARWAATRFPEESREVAAYVAELFRECAGLELSELEPRKTFVADLRLDEETVELVMTIEEDLGFEIPDADASGLLTVADLVEYLHMRLRLSADSSADPS